MGDDVITEASPSSGSEDGDVLGDHRNHSNQGILGVPNAVICVPRNACSSSCNAHLFRTILSNIGKRRRILTKFPSI